MADEIPVQTKTKLRTATAVAIIGMILAAGFGIGWFLQYRIYRDYAIKNRETIKAIAQGDISTIKKNANYIRTGLKVNPDVLLKKIKNDQRLTKLQKNAKNKLEKLSSLPENEINQVRKIDQKLADNKLTAEDLQTLYNIYLKALGVNIENPKEPLSNELQRNIRETGGIAVTSSYIHDCAGYCEGSFLCTLLCRWYLR